METDDLEPAIVDWVREVTGATDVRIERRSGGASRAGYAVDAALADGTVVERWLRADTGHGPQSTTTYTLEREAAVYRALAGTGVRVPTVVAVHPTEPCFLAERVHGATWFAQITDPAEADATARAYMGRLAALHALDAHALALPELGAPTASVRTHVLDELAIWREQYVEHGADDPVISLALTWLHEHLPADADWPVVLVHGDAGPGNFLYAGGDVTAMLDWEMAHWGDLHDDLAWVCVRDVQERFGHLPDRFAEYTAAGGAPVDLDRLRYFRVLAQARCAIGTRRGLLARDHRGEIANHLIYSTLHLRLLADALADAMGIPIDPDGDVVGPAADQAEGWLFDVALADLRDVVVPALDPGFAARRAKGLARLLKHLRASATWSVAIEHAEQADLAVLCGRPFADAATGRRVLCDALDAGTVDLRAATAYAVRHSARRVHVARDAMGALADRRYSPIDPASG